MSACACVYVCVWMCEYACVYVDAVVLVLFSINLVTALVCIGPWWVKLYTYLLTFYLLVLLNY